MKRLNIGDPADKNELDRIIDQLSDRKDQWALLQLEKKIDYLRDIREKTFQHAETWVKVACDAKSIDVNSPLANEEWLTGPFAIIYAIDGYIKSLNHILNGKPTYDGQNKITYDENDQLVVEVFPTRFYDRIIFGGIKGLVRMQPGVTRENLRENTARFYRKTSPRGKTAVVLGAGNIASIAPLDVVQKMFVEGQVSMLKMNPVNDYLAPVFKEVFSALITDHYFEVICGDSGVGAYLTNHEKIEAIHLTGSEQTYNKIVFGSGSHGDENKNNDRPVIDKEITAELGGVSPSIVVPGPWTKKDIACQAENLLIQKIHNAGFNCIASQIIVTPAEWDKTPQLMNELKKKIDKLPKRNNYYPGYDKRAEEIGKFYNTIKADKAVYLIEDLPVNGENEFAYQNEFFSNIWGITGIPGKDAETFLNNAIQFCNQNLHGSLGANIIIHPQTLKELGPKFDQLLNRLKYGSIGVNIWSAAGFALAQTTWGAYPGNKRNDAGSGIGNVHNTFLFDKPERSIIYADFYPFPRGIIHGHFSLLPKPPWFRSNRKGHIVSKNLTAFQHKPGLIKLIKVVWPALWG